MLLVQALEEEVGRDSISGTDGGVRRAVKISNYFSSDWVITSKPCSLGLGNRVSAWHDDIPITIVRKALNIILKLLTHIINSIWDTHYTNDWSLYHSNFVW